MDFLYFLQKPFSKNIIAARAFFASNINLFLLLWLAWMLFPLFLSGFISDDAYNSQIQGILLHSNISLFDRIVSEITYWLSLGRFNPLNWIFWYSYFYLLPSLLLFKLFVFFIIYLNLIYFEKILKFITQSRSFSYCVVFLLPILFQFRYWHDPFLAFASIPLACLLFFFSLYLLIRYIETAKTTYYWYHLLVFLISLLCYELSYISPLFYFLIIYLKNKSLKKSFLLIAIPIALILLHFMIKGFFSSTSELYPGTIFSFNFGNIIQAFYIQLISTFPLTWNLAEGFSNLSFLKINFLDFIVSAVLTGLVVFLLSTLNARDENINKYRSRSLITFSLLLILVPAFIVAISGHQSELIKAGIGYGYLPVFLQYFGLASLIFIIIRVITQSTTLSICIWFIFFVIVSFTRLENYHVVQESNIFYKYPRELLEASIKKGILTGVTRNDLIIIDSKYPFDHSWFYSMVMQKEINVCSINLTSKGKSISKENVESHNKKFGTDSFRRIRFPYCLNYRKWNNFYGLSYHNFSDYKSGQVIFTTFEEVNRDSENQRFKFKKYKIFDKLSNKMSTKVEGKYYDFNKLRSIDRSSLGNGYFYLLPSLLLEEVFLSFSGFHAEEGTRDNYLRWSSGKSKIIITNDSDEVKSRVLNFSIVRPNNENLPLQIKYDKKIIKDKVQNYKKFSLKLLLEPGETIIEISSELQSLNNGDPREIVFGVVNYALYLSK